MKIVQTNVGSQWWKRDCEDTVILFIPLDFSEWFFKPWGMNAICIWMSFTKKLSLLTFPWKYIMKQLVFENMFIRLLFSPKVLFLKICHGWFTTFFYLSSDLLSIIGIISFIQQEAWHYPFLALEDCIAHLESTHWKMWVHDLLG